MTAALLARRLTRVCDAVYDHATGPDVMAMLEHIAQSNDMATVGVSDLLRKWQAEGAEMPEWAPALMHRADEIRASCARTDREIWRRQDAKR
jgi:hypothetical protein